MQHALGWAGLHSEPTSAQKSAVVQVLPAPQTPEQHGVPPAEHEAFSSRHVGPPPVVHTPPEQLPWQHPRPPGVHGSFSPTQVGGAWHVPDWQVSVPQQAIPPAVHAWPLGTQVGGASHVPDVPQTLGLQQRAPAPQD